MFRMIEYRVISVYLAVHFPDTLLTNSVWAGPRYHGYDGCHCSYCFAGCDDGCDGCYYDVMAAMATTLVAAMMPVMAVITAAVMPATMVI